jgi:hypothetical protein
MLFAAWFMLISGIVTIPRARPAISSAGTLFFVA